MWRLSNLYNNSKDLRMRIFNSVSHLLPNLHPCVWISHWPRDLSLGHWDRIQAILIAEWHWCSFWSQVLDRDWLLFCLLAHSYHQSLFFRKVGFFQHACWKMWADSFSLILCLLLRFFGTNLIQTFLVFRFSQNQSHSFSIHVHFCCLSNSQPIIYHHFSNFSIFGSVLKDFRQSDLLSFVTSPLPSWNCLTYSRACVLYSISHKLDVTFCKCQWHYSLEV